MQRVLRPVLFSLLSAHALVAEPAAPIAADLPAVGISYTIVARFDPATRGIDGRETIRWRNDTGEAVSALPLHLYLNAFAHTGTSWMREHDFRDDADRVLRLSDDPWGHNEPRAIRQLEGGVRRELAWQAIQPDDGNPIIKPNTITETLFDQTRVINVYGFREINIDIAGKGSES